MELKFEFNKDSYLGLLIFCQYFLFLALVLLQIMLDWIKSKTSKGRKDFGKYSFHIKSEP